MNYFCNRLHDSFLLFYSIPAIFCLIGNVVFYLIANAEPTPYIDEIFHVGQCQEYCNGNFFTYDPKLTTPPGLYAITVLTLAPFLKLFGLECTVNTLRSVNVAVSLLLLVLLYRILRNQIYQQQSSVSKLWLALNLSTFPILYFYVFLYYTDTISTFLVLLTYHLYNVNYSHAAGLAGLLSITVRQTNLVWFLCFAAVKCCRNVENKALFKGGKSISEAKRRKFSYTWAYCCRCATNWAARRGGPIKNSKISKTIVTESWKLMRQSPSGFYKSYVLKETYLLTVSVALAAWLMTKNGGSLVLGDKSAHQAVLHVPQILYFSLFTAIFSFPLCWAPTMELLRNGRKLAKYGVACVLALALIVAYNTMAHLYLISDNRHYTFYIWKRVYERPFGKYAVIPLYVISMYCIAANTSHLDAYTKLGYLLSAVLCLVPQKLLEFRYFIVAYLLYRVETYHRTKWWHLALEFAFNVIVNYLTISFFIRLPFSWPDGTTQRFSW